MDSFRNAWRTFTICERAAAVQAIALEEDPHAGGTDKKQSSVSLWRLGRFPRIPCIRSSALSRDTSGFASRERSQGRSAKRAFIVRPLTPRTARHHSVQTKRSFVLFRIPFPLSTKARSFEIPRGI